MDSSDSVSPTSIDSIPSVEELAKHGKMLDSLVDGEALDIGKPAPNSDTAPEEERIFAVDRFKTVRTHAVKLIRERRSACQLSKKQGSHDGKDAVCIALEKFADAQKLDTAAADIAASAWLLPEDKFLEEVKKHPADLMYLAVYFHVPVGAIALRKKILQIPQ